MKIVSKDSVEVQHAVKPAKTRHRTSYEGKPSKPSIVISDAKDPVAQRKAHLAREKRRREAIRNKKKAGKQKEVTKSRDEPTYFRSKYDEFISLIRFNITFKLSIGYALRLISLLLFLFVSIYFAFSYYLYYSCRESLSANSELTASINWNLLQILKTLKYSYLTKVNPWCIQVQTVSLSMKKLQPIPNMISGLFQVSKTYMSIDSSHCLLVKSGWFQSLKI
jgi:hypothetical protein